MEGKPQAIILTASIALTLGKARTVTLPIVSFGFTRFMGKSSILLLSVYKGKVKLKRASCRSPRSHSKAARLDLSQDPSLQISTRTTMTLKSQVEGKKVEESLFILQGWEVSQGTACKPA